MRHLAPNLCMVGDLTTLSFFEKTEMTGQADVQNDVVQND